MTLRNINKNNLCTGFKRHCVAFYFDISGIEMASKASDTNTGFKKQQYQSKSFDYFSRLLLLV